MNRKRFKFGLFVVLTMATTLCAGFFALAFAADPSSAAYGVTSTAQMLPSHTVPALQALPATKTPLAILLWVLGSLIPWVGWLVSEALPFLPGKVNGLLQGIVLFCKAFALGPNNSSVTVQLDEMRASIAELKGQQPPSTGPGA